MDGMASLYAAAAFFAGIHLLISGTFLRGFLAGITGERGFLAAFSLMSIGGIVWLVMAYNAAVVADVSAPLWDFGPGVRHAGTIVVFIAIMLVYLALTTPSPTMVGAEGLAAKPESVRGILRITRHPMMWGISLWAAFHMAANGDLPSVIFFGTFLAVAFLGTFSIDAKRSKRLGKDWDVFARATSNVPFAAILAGRTSLSIREIGIARLAGGIATYAIFLFVHHYLFSVSPFPGGYVPF